MNAKLLKVFSAEQLRLVACVLSAEVKDAIAPSELDMISSEQGYINFFYKNNQRTVLTKERFWLVAKYA